MVSIGDFALESGAIVGVVCTPDARDRALEVARAFRGAGFRTEVDLMQRGMGAQLSHAAKTADFAVVLGKREVEAGTVTLKDLHSGEQQERSLEDAIAEVARHGAC
jgi:histidyl-tRNA synthetase